MVKVADEQRTKELLGLVVGERGERLEGRYSIAEVSFVVFCYGHYVSLSNIYLLHSGYV